MSDIKTIAFYLPQFHAIPENDKFWGEGFTEWNNVKSATPLFDGHNQPRVPYNGNYYDLSDVKVMEEHCRLAKENGLYGFCFYHYWFDGNPVMSKPIINYLNDKDIDFPYCLSWANESWTNAWAKPDNKVMLEQKYGNKEEWKNHFEFLLPFFKDVRYIKENNCPLMIIYRPYLFDGIIEMMDYWKKLAIDNGFDGIKFLSQRYENHEFKSDIYQYMDYNIEYQPYKCFSEKDSPSFVIKSMVKVQDFILKTFNIDVSFRKKKGKLQKYDYDEMWERIISQQPVSEKSIAGAFVDWDNTPRYKYRGKVFIGASPEKFKKYMIEQINHIKHAYNNDYLFIFAWNEWGEGGYLEPDKENGFGYLRALKESLENA